MVRSSLPIAFWGTAGLIALASPAALADTSLTATGQASSGYSTNIEGVPNNDPLREVQGDGFSELTPGLAAAYERRSSIHNLRYSFGARLFLRNSEANSYTNTLNYQSLFMLSERTTLRTGAGLNSGRVNAFDQAGSGIVGEGEVLPSGDVEFIAYNGNASLRRLLSQNWTGEASFNFAQFEPTNGMEVRSTRTLEQRLRLDRGFRRHLLGVEAHALYTGQQGAERERTLTVGPGLIWTWNLSSAFSTNTTAGVDIVGRYPSFNQGVTVPRGSAALTYSHERGRATTGAAYGATTNLFGGDTTITKSVFANVGMPVPVKRPTVVTLSAAYAVGDVVDIDRGESRASTKRRSADISVGTELNRAWQLGFRFETSKQELADVDDQGMPRDSVIRQTVGMVFLVGRFPEAVAAQVPPRSGDRVESGNADFSPAAGPAGAATRGTAKPR